MHMHALEIYMTNFALTLFRTKNRALGAIFPSFAAKQARGLFLRPRRYPVKDWEAQMETRGRRMSYSQGLSALAWGESERKVLLVHGWESRATQMSGFVDELVNAGYQVIAIDGPAHGHSQGRRANPYLFAQAVTSAYQTLGPFEGVVGHSMGGNAVATAIAEGIDPSRVVLISSPSSIEGVLQRSQHASWLNPVIHADTYYIHAISVKPEYRGKRVGYRLMDSAINSAREQGFSKLQLDVLSGNPAVEFYRAVGFELLAETRAPKPAAFGVPPEYRMGIEL